MLVNETITESLSLSWRLSGQFVTQFEKENNLTQSALDGMYLDEFD